MLSPADLALFDAASQSGLDLTGLDETAAQIAMLACQRAPVTLTGWAGSPVPLLAPEKPRGQLIAQVAGALESVTTGDLLRAVLRHFRADELVRLGPRARAWLRHRGRSRADCHASVAS